MLLCHFLLAPGKSLHLLDNSFISVFEWVCFVWWLVCNLLPRILLCNLLWAMLPPNTFGATQCEKVAAIILGIKMSFLCMAYRWNAYEMHTNAFLAPTVCKNMAWETTVWWAQELCVCTELWMNFHRKQDGMEMKAGAASQFPEALHLVALQSTCGREAFSRSLK